MIRHPPPHDDPVPFVPGIGLRAGTATQGAAKSGSGGMATMDRPGGQSGWPVRVGTLTGDQPRTIAKP